MRKFRSKYRKLYGFSIDEIVEKFGISYFNVLKLHYMDRLSEFISKQGYKDNEYTKATEGTRK